jgi:hypothetical protein
MPQVVCVLRTGGVYTPSWVRALHRGVREYLPNADFICLSDQPFSILGVERIPLRYRWKGWWSKVEIFRPGLFTGPTLYLDLDSLPIGFLGGIAGFQGDFATLSDFYQLKHMASGVMAWTPGGRSHGIYETFLQDPEGIMRTHPGRSDHWYRRVLGEVQRLQSLFPGQIVSYKAHARNGPPKDARLVCGHGNPRFSSPSAGWTHKLWKERAR